MTKPGNLFLKTVILVLCLTQLGDDKKSLEGWLLVNVQT